MPQEDHGSCEPGKDQTLEEAGLGKRWAGSFRQRLEGEAVCHGPKAAVDGAQAEPGGDVAVSKETSGSLILANCFFGPLHYVLPGQKNKTTLPLVCNSQDWYQKITKK